MPNKKPRSSKPVQKKKTTAAAAAAVAAVAAAKAKKKSYNPCKGGACYKVVSIFFSISLFLNVSAKLYRQRSRNPVVEAIVNVILNNVI